MKIIKPMFYGELKEGSELLHEGFLIKKISRLNINASHNPTNDLLCLPGVCCLVTETGKNALISLGLASKYFHTVNCAKIINTPLFFIDIDAKDKGIEVYRGTSLQIDEAKFDKLNKLINISKCKVN